MTELNFDQLVAEIGEQLLARLGQHRAAAGRDGRSGEGQVCPGDGQPGGATGAGSREAIVAAGTDGVTASGWIRRADPEVAGLIDHTLLKPEATREQIVKLCEEAREFGFATVCVNPCWVGLAAEQLRGTGVGVCTVVGFPLGATSTDVKIYETESAIRAGATEIDMVMNIGALRSGDGERVRLDIKGVVEVAHRYGVKVKVILETSYLTAAEKVIACQLCRQAGADFVKTSTGFGPGGATAEDVALMRAVVGEKMGVKAAGGIRSYADFVKMKAAGATRIGASASVKIVQEAAG